MTSYEAVLRTNPVQRGSGTHYRERRDPILRGSNDGIKFLFDFSFPWCYPGGAKTGRPAAGNPGGGAAIRDLSGHGDGVIQIGGGTVAYAGGGFDFSSVTTRGTEIVAPSGCLSSIWGDGSKAQKFALVTYLKIPPKTIIQAMSGIRPFFCTTDANQGYYDQSDLMTMTFMVGGILIRRQKSQSAHTTSETNFMFGSDDYYEKVCQLAFVNTGSMTLARLARVADDAISTLSVNSIPNTDAANNVSSFSTMQPRWGACYSYNTNPPAGVTGLRIYRGYVQDTVLDTRDPWTVADDDFRRVMFTRNEFS